MDMLEGTVEAIKQSIVANQKNIEMQASRSPTPMTEEEVDFQFWLVLQNQAKILAHLEMLCNLLDLVRRGEPIPQVD